MLNLVVERISNVRVNEPTEDEIPWMGSNFDFMKYSLERPYMYGGKAEDIENSL